MSTNSIKFIRPSLSPYLMTFPIPPTAIIP